MRQTLLRLWSDDGGAIIAVEWLFFVTIVVVGLVVGFVAIRNAVVDELTVMANAIDSLGVCYSFAGLENCESSVCGTHVCDIVGVYPIHSNKTDASNKVILAQNPCQ